MKGKCLCALGIRRLARQAGNIAGKNERNGKRVKEYENS